MFPFADSKPAEVPPPCHAPTVLSAIKAAQDARAQYESLLAEWQKYQTLKQEEADKLKIHDADRQIARLKSEILDAEGVLLKAEREETIARRNAEQAYTAYVLAGRMVQWQEFVETYLRPAMEAHELLRVQRDSDEQLGVRTGNLPPLFEFLMPDSLSERLRYAQREGLYPDDGWVPKTN